MKQLWLGVLMGMLLGSPQRSLARSQGAQDNQEQPASVTLSNNAPSASFPVSDAILQSAPPVLALRVSRVVNPSALAVHLLVYLTYGGQAHASPQKILIGDVGFYPPDRPAGFLLRSSRAFDQLKAVHPHPVDVRLLLELRRLHQTQPWSPVQLTVAPPEWRSAPND